MQQGCPPLISPISVLNPNIFNELSGIKTRDTVDQSGAFSLEDAAHIASIGSSIISAGESLFGG